MEIWKHWLAFAPQCPPVGYILRERIPDRWIRIHNLPAGKRMPADDSEMSEILWRNNVVATSVLGLSSGCIAFRIDWGAYEGGDSWNVIDSVPVWQLNKDEAESIMGATFRCRTFRWRPGEFDDEILEAALGRLGGLTIFSLATKGIYCPYNGGADIFVPEPADVGSLKSLFRNWLSELSSGL